MSGATRVPGGAIPTSPGSPLKGDIALALGVAALLVVLIIPLPSWLIDVGLAVSITASILVLMVALFIQRPLDFTSFPTILLLTTLMRLALNVATTRIILTNGHEGPAAAGHVVKAFGGYLMGGDVAVGVVVFAILLIVNFMVITKGAGRIAEVAARFSLDAMPGKQMAIDADLSAGAIDDTEARRRRREVEQETGFYGSMDGAAKFVRGEAVAGLIVTFVNLLGGVAIGSVRYGLSFSEAIVTYSTLTVGDGLVSQIPALLVSVAAGIVVTKGATEGRADELLSRELAARPKPLAIAAGAALVLALMPGLPMLPFLALAGFAGTAAWSRRGALADATGAAASPAGDEADPRGAPGASALEPEEALRIDVLRLELGYGLLPIASGESSRLTDQIRAMRRSLAAELGIVVPSVRVRDSFELPSETYVIRLKEMEIGRGALKPPRLLALVDANDTFLTGERTTEPAFGIPAVWIEEMRREEALARGYTVVACSEVLVTHLTELIRGNAGELLSYAETRKLLDGLAEEHRKLVADLVPAVASIGTIQRVLQGLLAERVSIRDLPTILEGINEASSGGMRSLPQIIATVRFRLARQLCEAVRHPDGHLPLITLSTAWEVAFAEALTGPTEDRQLAMEPSRLQDFVRRLTGLLDDAASRGEAPAVVCSALIRLQVRAVLERVRPSTAVLAQSEIHPTLRIRTLGTV